VCEGHGDLRCEHVSLAGDAIAIIDCVEFSEGLRYVDVASDAGFLAMDLDRLGARGLADELVGAYREASGDADLPLLVPLYKIHRALVRAKVESLTSRDLAIAPAQRAAAAAAARSYVELALDLARESRPALVVVCGLSGSGKSTVARRLADRLGFQWLRSDEIRKRLAGVAPAERLSDSYAAGAYSPEFTRQTYGALLDAAAARLRDGDGVIVDATFAAPAYRAAALALAARAGVSPLFVECSASHDEIVRRLTRRARNADEISDAGVAIYLRQRAEFVALEDLPQSCHLVADTERGLEAVSASIGERLKSLGRASG
jgi:predicted kinase